MSFKDKSKREINLYEISETAHILINDFQVEIQWNANLMQQGNFIDVFLARHISGTYANHQEH